MGLLLTTVLFVLLPSISSTVPCEGGGTDGIPRTASPLAVMSVEIDISPDQLEARPTNSQNGPVMFDGTANVLHVVPGAKVTVTLSASCEWVAILSPSTMVFSESVPQAFFVTVVVPPKTVRGEREELRVSATAKAPLLPVMTDTTCANVTVAPYYHVRIDGLEHRSRVERGSTVEVTLNVTNLTNLDLTFHLVLGDPPLGITAEPTLTTALEPNHNAFVTIHIDVSGEAAAGTHKLRIDVVYPEQAQGAPPCSATPELGVVDVASSTPSWSVTWALLLVLVVLVGIIVWARWRRGTREASP